MRVSWWSAVGLVLLASSGARGGLPEVEPRTVGLDAARLERIGPAVERAIARGQVPGAVVLIGRRGKVAYVRAFGRRAEEPASEPMTRETVFDLASLTKPVATATSLMTLIERGKVRLDDPIVKHLPEFDNHGKGAITVEHLLRHRGGLVADNPLRDFADGPEASWKRLAEIELIARPGERYLYSDVGFLILGRLVERLTKVPLATFSRDEVFVPLGMRDTSFLPIGSPEALTADPGRFAPTEKEGGRWLRGVVHDPRARALGGVAGHAGLFGTADDLALFAQMLLDRGQGPNGSRVLEPATVASMIAPGDTPKGQRRGLGWDIDSPHSRAPKGEGFGPRSFGHTGFTGTSLWIDPDTATFVVILSSRLHPRGKGDAGPLRREVATLANSAIVDDMPPRKAFAKPEPVACGVDVLARSGFEPLRGKRVGLVTNQTGKTLDGVSTIDLLFRAPEVKLVRLFSPEHGIRGLVDAEVADSQDEATGLPIVSLYGKSRKPSRASLQGVEVLVYDIQDVGARFYTYISTLGLVLEAAAEAAIPVVVLDRPNPIGGVDVGGPVRDDDPEFATFIAHHALPVRHGMTVGELARLFNAERKIGAELRVIPCEGWRRASLFDRTGLTWINPSPNMRSPTEALLYPGIGLLEATNLATGRGTDTPFERIGASWIDPRGLASTLNHRGLPGVRFVPVRFTPRERQYAGKECGGVFLIVDDWSRFDPLAVAIEMAVVLRREYPDRWEPSGFLKMIADRATYRALLGGKSGDEIRALWEPELAAFRAIRSRYLLYE